MYLQISIDVIGHINNIIALSEVKQRLTVSLTFHRTLGLVHVFRTISTYTAHMLIVVRLHDGGCIGFQLIPSELTSATQRGVIINILCGLDRKSRKKTNGKSYVSQSVCKKILYVY